MNTLVHLILVLLACFTYVNSQEEPLLEEFAEYRYALCGFINNRTARNNEGSLRGNMAFRQKWYGGAVDVIYNVSGFNVDDQFDEHAIAIHEMANFNRARCSVDFGGHYNPLGVYHGPRTAPPSQRHIGDLGTIREDAARDGRSTGAFTIPDFPDIMGEFGILGRSVFIYQESDDFGRGGNENSRLTGSTTLPGQTCCVIARISGGNGIFFD